FLSKHIRTIGETQAGAKIVLVRIVQLIDVLDRAVYKTLRPEDVVAHQAFCFVDRRKVFPAQTEVHRQVLADSPVILSEQRICCRTKISLAVQTAARRRVKCDALKKTA